MSLSFLKLYFSVHLTRLNGTSVKINKTDSSPFSTFDTLVDLTADFQNIQIFIISKLL